ncbi:hypothetical protein [Marichromatium bheemlicum]|nr:hypothetical protein [Marichromatium bheemlicum]
MRVDGNGDIMIEPITGRRNTDSARDAGRAGTIAIDGMAQI